MKAIKTKNTMKQLTLTFSMLLFLFTAGNLYSQQVAGMELADMAATSSKGATINLHPESQLGIDVLQSIPVQYDRNTLLSYSIPRQMDVEIKMYDKAGMELKTVVSGVQDAGTHEIDLYAAGFKNGIYFYQLSVGNYSEVKKINLVN